jgi:hypothetical protein
MQSINYLAFTSLEEKMKLAMALLTGGFFALSSGVQAQHSGLEQKYNGLQDLQRAAHSRHEQMLLEQQQLRALQERDEYRRRDHLRSLRLRGGNSWGGHRFRLRAWAAATLAKDS